jgi:hypothetical protein
MYPILPTDTLASAVETACYGFTVLAAFITYFVNLR